MVSGVTRACAASAALRISVEHRRVLPTMTSTSGRDDRRDRARILCVGGEDEPGGEQIDDVAQLAEIGRDQRIGRRDRRIGDADVIRRQAQQRVFEIVAREDNDRTFGRETARQQRGADAADFLQRLRIGDACASRPAGSRSAMNTRSGATCAQCTRRSVSFAGYARQRAAGLEKDRAVGAPIDAAPRARRVARRACDALWCLRAVAQPLFPLVPAKAGTQSEELDARFRGHERRVNHFRSTLAARFSRKSRDALLGLLVALRDRRGQRLHHIAAGAVLLGDARQHIDDREVRGR